jgi:hypothetical protein
MSVMAASTLFVGRLPAQTVQGILLGEKSQMPVAKAQVALLDDSGHVASTTMSDSASGTFYLDVPKSGRYQIRTLIGRGGLSYSPFFTVDSNETIEHKFVVPDWPKAVLEAYLEEDVAKPAAYKAGNRSPRYPDALRAAQRRGVVRAMCVIGINGRPVENTFRVIESDDEAFTKSLEDWFETAQFIPAEREGVKVPQVFEMGIDFGFGTEPARLSVKHGIVVRALGVFRVR